MTPTFYLLLSISLFFFLTTCVYAMYCNQRRFTLTYEDILNENETTSDNLSTETDPVSINKQKACIGKPKKKASVRPEKNIDVQLELKKCKQQLTRSLKTLSYISVMEADNSLDGERLKDLGNLKESVQFEVVRITKQINFLRTQFEAKVAV